MNFLFSNQGIQTPFEGDVHDLTACGIQVQENVSEEKPTIGDDFVENESTESVAPVEGVVMRQKKPDSRKALADLVAGMKLDDDVMIPRFDYAEQDSVKVPKDYTFFLNVHCIIIFNAYI